MINGSHSKPIWRIPDIFFLLRPTLWFPVWTMILIGTRGGWDLLTYNSILTALALTCLMGAVYLLNQVKDIDSDRESGKLPLLHKGFISIRTSKIVLVALVLAGTLLLGISAQIGTLLLVAALIVLAGIMYSLGKRALKNSYMGSLTASLFSGLGLLLLGKSLAGLPLSYELILDFGFALAFLATSLLTMIPDLDGDEVTGKRTFAVHFGREKTLRLASIIVIVAFFIGLHTGSLLLTSSAGLSIPLFVFTSRGKERYLYYAIKWPIFLLSLLVGIFYYPLYLILIAVYFPIARLYHSKRLGMNYPSFGSDNRD